MVSNNIPTTPTRRGRSSSFASIDEAQASGILEDLLRENGVLLGGSSIGKGFHKAARYHICHSLRQRRFESLKQEEENVWDEDEAFYIVDLGVVVSQVYQWRKFFPRVEPFYAVKCNPDAVVIQTLATLGCHFDCASIAEIDLVQRVCRDLKPRQPEIIYANPCKAPHHLQRATLRHGVRMVTFDNVVEVYKCAAISQQLKENDKIQLILRIVTDDRGAQCRLSSKFGAHRAQWRNLLQAAQRVGLPVVGVSFHVGSGCRDVSRYVAALKDARELFDMAASEFGMEMTILDIGGGFPGETYSTWNPHVLDQEEDDDDDDKTNDSAAQYLFFNEAAETIAPLLDKLFPPHVRIIAEPGRYFVAAAATLVTSIVGARSNEVDATTFAPHAISDVVTANQVNQMTRAQENLVIHQQQEQEGLLLQHLGRELTDYAKLHVKQTLVQQEADVYNDALDLYYENIDTAADLLGVPDEIQRQKQVHTVEGLAKSVAVSNNNNLTATATAFASGQADATAAGSYNNNNAGGGADADTSICSGINDIGSISGGCVPTTLAAAEAALNGLVLQAVADSAPPDFLQDDYAYYVNDGVYGGFNNLMFDHATVRPRVLKHVYNENNDNDNDNDNHDCRPIPKRLAPAAQLSSRGLLTLRDDGGNDGDSNDKSKEADQLLYASTIFGPTCDSIDVISRSILLPKLRIGDWLYFQNMGAYTMAAASKFNGFAPAERVYVCSVQPEYFEGLIAGPEEQANNKDDEQKEK